MHMVMNMCHLTINCTRHPIPTSLLMWFVGWTCMHYLAQNLAGHNCLCVDIFWLFFINLRYILQIPLNDWKLPSVLNLNQLILKLKRLVSVSNLAVGLPLHSWTLDPATLRLMCIYSSKHTKLPRHQHDFTPL